MEFKKHFERLMPQLNVRPAVMGIVLTALAVGFAEDAMAVTKKKQKKIDNHWEQLDPYFDIEANADSNTIKKLLKKRNITVNDSNDYPAIYWGDIRVIDIPINASVNISNERSKEKLGNEILFNIKNEEGKVIFKCLFYWDMYQIYDIEKNTVMTHSLTPNTPSGVEFIGDPKDGYIMIRHQISAPNQVDYSQPTQY